MSVEIPSPEYDAPGIDPNVETPIRLAKARSLRCFQRDGKRPDLSTLHRWATRGVRGVVLETINVGASKCTSAEAAMRFIRRLSGAAQPAPAVRTPHQREKQIRRAEAELAAAGI